MRAAIILLPLAGMTIGSAQEIVVFIFTPAYMPAAHLLSILIFSSLAFTMIAITMTIFTAASRPGLTIALTGPLLPLVTVAHVLLIPRFGPLGAALATSFIAVLGASVTVLAVYRVWKILPPASTLIRGILISGAAYMITAFWPTPGFLLFIKLPLIGLLVLFAYVLLGEIKTGELAVFRSLIHWPSDTEQMQDTF